MKITLRSLKTGQTFTGLKLQETSYGWLLQQPSGWVWFGRSSYELVKEQPVTI